LLWAGCSLDDWGEVENGSLDFGVREDVLVGLYVKQISKIFLYFEWNNLFRTSRYQNQLHFQSCFSCLGGFIVPDLHTVRNLRRINNRNTHESICKLRIFTNPLHKHPMAVL
jgi:hypothetical protein